MVTSQHACLAGWLLASCFPLNALAQPSAAAVSLTVRTAAVYTLGEPMEISLILTNRGAKPLSVFHPRLPQLQWSDWSIGCQVTNPTGRVARLIPAILDSRVPIPEEGDVVVLSQGDTVATVLILRNQDPLPPSRSEEALVLALAIPLSQTEDGMTEGSLRQRFEIRGRFSLVNGGESYLEVADVSSNVFDLPGSYQLECGWSNAITDVWVSGARNSLVSKAVEGLVVWDVSGVAKLEIKDSAGQGDR